MTKKITIIFESLAILCLVLLIAVIVIGVISRFLSISVPWYDEVASVLLVWTTYLGSAYIMIIRGHMSFDGLLLKLSYPLRVIFFVIGELVVLGFFIIIGIYGFMVLEIFGDESLVSLPSVSLAYTQSIIPIFSIFFIIAQFISMKQAWNNIVFAISEEDKHIQETIEKTQNH